MAVMAWMEEVAPGAINSPRSGTATMSDKTPHIAVTSRLVLLRQWQADSAAEFCRKAGISTSAWNNYETGDRRINVDTAITLCDRFGVRLIGFTEAGLPAFRMS